MICLVKDFAGNGQGLRGQRQVTVGQNYKLHEKSFLASAPPVTRRRGDGKKTSTKASAHPSVRTSGTPAGDAEG